MVSFCGPERAGCKEYLVTRRREGWHLNTIVLLEDAFFVQTFKLDVDCVDRLGDSMSGFGE